MDLPRYIELETSRFCNRRCQWCPNHMSQQRRSQELMDWSTLVYVLESLARHSYSGWLAFHNYNEPLANPRILFEIECARKLLPATKLTIFTNGDYLTPELLDRLLSAGLSQLRITVYPRRRENTTPSHAHLWRWLRRRALLPQANWEEARLRQGPGLVLHEPMSIEVISPDVSRYYDRGSTVPALSIAQRAAPCFLTSHSLSIDFRGQVKMCCNVVTDHGPHAPYFLGNVPARDPVELWSSDAFAELRRRHLAADWSATPICTTCRQELPRP